MSNSRTQREKVWLVAATCAGAIASLALESFAQQVDATPPSPDYRGEIRRGPDGKLMAVQPAKAVERSPSAPAATMIVGVGERVQTVTEAAHLAKDGDVIEIKSGEYRHQPAVWTQDNLIVRGAGHRPVMIGEGASAEGKGIWVVRGKKVTIENIEFRGARVPDQNGAGIRFESGHLTVRNCGFFDNEMGILTGNDGVSKLDVIDSEFGEAPQHVGVLHHLLYVGAIARFTLTGSRLQHGFLGHLVKSRARESVVTYNMLVDGDKGRASYELEFPNGGIAVVIGNAIGQSIGTDNPVVVAYGAEGRRWGGNALYLVHNTLISESVNGEFLHSWTDKLPPETEVWAINNLTVGKGVFAPTGPGRFEGNSKVERSDLIPMDGIPLRLPNGHPLRGTVRLPGSAGELDLSPKAEFTLPIGTKPISLSTRLAPGAFQ